MTMRSALLVISSFILTGMVFANAYFQRQQFYPSVVYITKSNASMAVVYTQAFVMVVLAGKLMSKLFFGQLRAAEFEHLTERSWYAVTETCLAFTAFKDDFSPTFVAMFTLLLFLKSFHWLSEERVDFMERSPTITVLFHLRLITLTCLLLLADMLLMSYAYHITMTKGASVQLVFGFEYAILLTAAIYTYFKYVLHVIFTRFEHPWEGKAFFMLYAELAIALIKAVLYVMFVVIMIRIYTLPLFAVRPMYLAMRSFKKAFNDVVLSRKAIHYMNTLCPPATEEDLASSDNVCIICREEMTVSGTKKLPCNHIFHKACLRSWFQRQQTCPTCRLNVLDPSVYPGAQEARSQRPTQDQRHQAAAAANGAANGAAQHRPVPAPPPAPLPHPPFNPNVFAQLMNNAAEAAAAAALRPPQRQTGETAEPGVEASVRPDSGRHQQPVPATASFPSFTPPHPFMHLLPPPPFIVPPPMPPPNFAGLTDDELRELEGNERKNIEARVKCLRNIQVLLDAAVMEMQQYSTVVSRQQPPTTENASAAPVPRQKVEKNPLDTNSIDVPGLPGQETGAIPKAARTSTGVEEAMTKMNLESATPSSAELTDTNADGDSCSPTADQLRRRRLEKFSNVPEEGKVNPN